MDSDDELAKLLIRRQTLTDKIVCLERERARAEASLDRVNQRIGTIRARVKVAFDQMCAAELRYNQGRTYREIARQLNIAPPRTAKVYATRGLQEIRAVAEQEALDVTAEAEMGRTE